MNFFIVALAALAIIFFNCFSLTAKKKRYLIKGSARTPTLLEVTLVVIWVRYRKANVGQLHNHTLGKSQKIKGK
jgi:hypothetical protein